MRVIVLIASCLGLAAAAAWVAPAVRLGTPYELTPGRTASNFRWLAVMLAMAGPAFVLGLLG